MPQPTSSPSAPPLYPLGNCSVHLHSKSYVNENRIDLEDYEPLFTFTAVTGVIIGRTSHIRTAAMLALMIVPIQKVEDLLVRTGTNFQDKSPIRLKGARNIMHLDTTFTYYTIRIYLQCALEFTYNLKDHYFLECDAVKLGRC
jgi:hypothetical protein